MRVAWVVNKKNSLPIQITSQRKRRFPVKIQQKSWQEKQTCPERREVVMD